MTLRLWEVVVAVIGLALASLFFAGGDLAGGVALLVFIIIGAASRARIVEQPVAGSYSRTRGIIGVVVTGTLFGVYCVVVVLFAIAAINHWMRSDRGPSSCQFIEEADGDGDGSPVSRAAQYRRPARGACRRGRGRGGIA
jgi:hypothetical protein